jgi:hypothetical protein
MLYQPRLLEEEGGIHRDGNMLKEARLEKRWNQKRAALDCMGGFVVSITTRRLSRPS